MVVSQKDPTGFKDSNSDQLLPGGQKAQSLSSIGGTFSKRRRGSS